jgi:hypothetical protein
MNRGKNLREEIGILKKELAEEIQRTESIERLIGERIDEPAPAEGELWGLTDYELEKVMWNEFLRLDKNKDCLSTENILSHRKKIGRLLVFLKKFFFRITRPYSSLILNQQGRFNRELMTFLLSTHLSLQKIKERLKSLEEQAGRLEGEIRDRQVSEGEREQPPGRPHGRKP